MHISNRKATAQQFIALLLIFIMVSIVYAQDTDIDPYEAVSSNAEWTPVERDFDGIAGVLVPAGCFLMGSPTQDETYEHCIDQPFWISKYEITNEQFLHFLDETNNQNDDEVSYYDTQHEFARITENEDGQFELLNVYAHHPVSQASWHGARDYCASIGGRLLTEPEWEYATQGPDNLVYAWGDEWQPANLVWAGTMPEETLTDVVGSKPDGVSWVGAYDLNGNVFEWLDTPEITYPYPAEDAEVINEDNRVLRGGSRGGSKGRHSFTPGSDGERRIWDTTTSNIDFGVRCAWDYEEDDTESSS